MKITAKTEKLIEDFENFIDDQYMIEGKKLITEIEVRLSGLDYNVPRTVLEKYDSVVNRNVWDNTSIEGLKEVRGLILNLQ